MKKMYAMARFFLTTLILTLSFFVVDAEAKMVSIAGKSVNLRSGPSTKYKVKFELGKGFPLKVIGSQGKWYKVRDFENDEGWIYTPLTDRKAHLIVKKPKVNVRSGPGKKYRIIGKANYGVVFRTLKRKKGWVRVRHEKGQIGWIARHLLWGW